MLKKCRLFFYRALQLAIYSIGVVAALPANFLNDDYALCHYALNPGLFEILLR